MIEKLNYEYGQEIKVDKVINKINEIIEAVNKLKVEDEELMNAFLKMRVLDCNKKVGV